MCLSYFPFRERISKQASCDHRLHPPLHTNKQPTPHHDDVISPSLHVSRSTTDVKKEKPTAADRWSSNFLPMVSRSECATAGRGPRRVTFCAWVVMHELPGGWRRVTVGRRLEVGRIGQHEVSARSLDGECWGSTCERRLMVGWLR